MATRSKIESDLVKRGSVERATADPEPALAKYCQRLGDDALILGQRLSES